MQNTNKAQESRTIARISGILMLGLLALHWYNTASFALSITTTSGMISNTFMPLLDLSAAISFIIAWKNEHKGGLVLFAVISTRLLWTLYGVHDGLTIISANAFGMISSITFLRASFLCLDKTEAELRIVGANELRILARLLNTAASVRYIFSAILYEFISTNGQVLHSQILAEYLAYVLLLVAGCVAGEIVARKRQLGGASLIIISSLLLIVWSIFRTIFMTAAVAFLIGGVLHVISSFLYDPKPEPLPELEE
jgi:hypothetical protein